MTPDLALSPRTGWTRTHWERLADSMLLAARPFGSPSRARILLPGAEGGYGRDVDGLEGFARTFLAAAFRLRGAGGADPLNLAEWYADGIAAGCDPANPERWVRPDEHGQAKVEAAAIALGLSFTRPLIWDRLAPAAQQNVVAWLSRVIGAEYPPINWVWFRIVVEQFLKEVDAEYSRDDLEHDLALHESFVREDGWYADGAERAYDHYVGWALHLYPVLWLTMAGPDDELAAPRRADYLARLDRFLPDAAALVGADGSPLVQGRSLIYRFAAAAPFWAGALAGSSALPPGLVRRAASGIVSHFVDHGALEPDGLLTLGWHREWRALAQSYSGPGSPYWASKGLLGLALPADHAVWTAVEEPLPIETGDVALVVRAPGWLVSGSRADGVVRVANHGTDHAVPGAEVTDAPLYARLGYSTASSPLLGPCAEEDALDQSVCLLDDRGRPSHRAGFETLRTELLPGGVLVGASRARAHWVEPDLSGPAHGSGRSGAVRRGPSITTVSVLRGAWEVRLVRVEQATGHLLRVGGWAAPEGAASELLPLRGEWAVATRADADATPLGASRTSVATSPVTAGEWTALAVRLRLPATPDDGAPALSLEDGAAEVRWPDGSRTLLDLPEVSPTP